MIYFSGIRVKFDSNRNIYAIALVDDELKILNIQICLTYLCFHLLKVITVEYFVMIFIQTIIILIMNYGIL